MEGKETNNALMKQILGMMPRVIEDRRDLHAHPEMAWCEFRTTSLVAERLSSLGYQVISGKDVCAEAARTCLPSPAVLDMEKKRALKEGARDWWADRADGGFTGVIGILRCGDGPVVTLRFDMDALPVEETCAETHEPSREGFTSVNKGVMHACGHDAHIAMGLAVAELLSGAHNELRGTVKLIFQPAEEGAHGAAAVVENGHLDDTDVLIATHINNRKLAKGAAIGFPLKPTLATGKFDAVITGKAAHAGSAPDQGDNAMLAAATAVLNLHAIPRSSKGETRINVGVLHAGSARNVICDEATLEYETRGTTTEANDAVDAYARRIIENAAAMHGCTCSITVTGGATAMRSDDDLIRLGSALCSAGGVAAETIETSPGFSEDVATMADRVREHGGKALFFYTLTEMPASLHSVNFDLKEDAMANGIWLFTSMTKALLTA